MNASLVSTNKFLSLVLRHRPDQTSTRPGTADAGPPAEVTDGQARR